MRPIRRSFEPEQKTQIKKVISAGDICQVTDKQAIGAKFVVAVDLNSIPHFDYEIKRAFDEIRLLAPDAAENMFIITLATLPGNIIRVTTPYSISVNDFTGEAFHLHNELSKYKIDSQIIICSTGPLALQLKFLDRNMYSGVINCLSTAHLIRTCFNIYYPDYKRVSDILTEQLSVVVKNEDDFLLARKIILKYFGQDGCAALRDPRFEMISGVRYNPWLASFELLVHNGLCSRLADGKQCGNVRSPGMNYCEDHKCKTCDRNCQHVGTMKVGKKKLQKK